MHRMHNYEPAGAKGIACILTHPRPLYPPSFRLLLHHYDVCLTGVT